MFLYLTAFLAAAACAILLISPATGILALMLFKPIIDTAWYQPLIGTISLTKMIGVAAPLLMFLAFFRSGERLSFRRTPFAALWVVSVVHITLFSSIIVLAKGPMIGIEIFFRHINAFLAFFLFQTFFSDDRQLRKLLLVLIFAGLFPTAVGLYQAATGATWHAGLAVDSTMGLQRNVGMYHDIVTVRQYTFAAIVSMLIYGRQFVAPQRKIWLLQIAYGICLAIVIFHGYSKSGFAIAALWFVIWTMLQRRLTAAAIMSVLTVAASATLFPWVFENVAVVYRREVNVLHGSGDLEQSFAGRWHGWYALADEWFQMDFFSQFFGTGIPMTGAHNDYIMFLYHGGVIGLLIYIALLGGVAVRLLAFIARRADPVSVGALLLLVMWLVDSVGLVPSAYPAYQWIVWGIVGIALRRRADENASHNAALRTTNL